MKVGFAYVMNKLCIGAKMTAQLSEKNRTNLIPIGQAAAFLGVSIDTLRRWDKSGKVTSLRVDGKNRSFDLDELRAIKFQKPLTISEAASKLGVSASTLRRYEAGGIIRPSRNGKGDRIYTPEILAQFKNNSQKEKEKVRETPQTEVVREQEKPTIRGLIKEEIGNKIDSFSGFFKARPSLTFASGIALTILIMLTVFVTAPDRAPQDYVLGARDTAGNVVQKITDSFTIPMIKVVDQYRLAFSRLSNFGGRTEIVEIERTDKTVIDIDIEDFTGTIPGLLITQANMAVSSVSGGVAGIILDSSITSADLAKDAVTGEKILNDTIRNEDIADSAIKSAKVEDNTLSANDLASILAFSDSDFLDLSGIIHDDIGLQGLRLPNVASASPVAPQSGEGYLAFDTLNNQVLVYDGGTWTGIGGSVTLAANGGLEYVSSELSLLTTCSGGQLLKWNGSAWACGNDTGGGGGGMATVEKGNVNAVTTAVSLDFSSDFGVTLDTGEGENEADITIDYTTSKITRTDQTQSVTGAWTFSNLTISDTDVSLSGASSALTATNALTLTSSGVNDLTLNAGSGAVKIATGDSIGNATWSIASTGLASGLSANDLTGCTDCIGATEIAESGISSTNLSDGANIAHINATESISGSWTFTVPTVIGNAAGNDFLEFTEEGTNPTCAVGLYAIWANSAGTLKKCQNGTITDLDTTGGGGSITVRETDTNPSVSSVTTLEFGPTVDSTADFVVTDQTGGVARIVLGSNVAHINATESVSGAWTFSNLTISDAAISLSGGSTTFDMTAATDTVFDITNAGAGVGKLRIDSLTNGGVGCNTIDTTADGTLICGTDEGGAGGGIATVRESDTSPSYGTLTTLEFGPATTSEDEFVVSNPSAGVARVVLGSKVAHIDATESVSGAWTFSNLAISDTSIPLSGGDTTVDITGAATRTINILNSTTTPDQVANLNLSDGSLQTGGTTRLDNSGNLTNIGNITGAGAVTIASTGAGNDVIINGADILDVQDNATFAGTVDITSTLAVNGNITLGNAAADQIALTGEITGATAMRFEGLTDNNIYTQFAFTDPTISSKTITFPDASITVNAASDLSGNTLASGVTGSSLTSVGTLTSLTVSGTITANGNVVLGNAATDQVTVTGEVLGNLPLSFEGTTDNNIYTIFQITDPTVSNKTVIFPNANITVNAAGDISGTTLASGVTGSSLTSVGTLSGLTVSGTIAANGGIAFDNSTDTVGAFTAAGLVNMNSTYYLENIGNANTDFTNTGGLTLAGTLAVNSGSITSTTNITIDGGSFTLGAGADTGTAVFAATTNVLSFTGTARPTRKVTLSPEYAGATLSGSGIGTMTSDFCEQGVHVDVPDTNTTSCEAGQIHNFYNWTTTQGSNQTYTAWVRWRVPDNWAAWDTNPIQVYGRRSDATNGSVKVYVYDVSGVLNNAGGTEVAAAANIWNQGNIALSGGTWTVGSYLTIRIDMVADNADNVKAGEININYLSNN